ncbi:hypothetical protein [Alteromonas sp. a30]|uniref:hypothetical protein n=1 Tax=Alteromonas sp. a30 TaxID=2730917 RepID=UPI002282C5CE|nr:hypothetical protein [Alteromonas sp. a30]MCY7294288.1 hypothetical protein [Alteromonas sp. a30]
MKKTKIWLPVIFSALSFASNAEDAVLDQTQLSQGSEINVNTTCNNWSLNCLLDKIVSSSSASLLGPGVSGDPS